MDIISKNDINSLATRVKSGDIIVFPTETSYALGCDATNQQAVDKIFDIKKRDKNKPLLIVVPDIESAKKYLVWNDNIEKLSKKYWPGPLTVIGEYSGSYLARGVVSQNNTVAVRVVDNLWLKQLCQNANCPLVATSANISGEMPLYDFAEIKNVFSLNDNSPDVLVDGGDLPKIAPTTVVDATGNGTIIKRQGAQKIIDFFGFIKISVFIFTAILSAISILFFWKIALIDIENNSWLTSSFNFYQYVSGQKNPLIKVKGIYLTAYSAGSAKKIEEIIALIKRTELNAVVIDIKDYSGLVLYDSQIPSVVELKTKDNRLGDVSSLVKKLKDENIYVIARQTVFQDPVLAENKSDWAIKNKNGGLWHDHKGLAWVDPTNIEVWKYNLAIAKEAAKFGFDEINFDYVRFPSDGRMSEVVYTVGDKKKYEVMREFFDFLSRGLSAERVWLSLDMFGFVMEKSGEDDMNIGQRLEDALDFADYVCPMMYPSHYPPGHLGLDNPADYPRLVFENGMEKGASRFEGRRAMLRPWIQAFDLGAVYGAEKIRAQIEVSEKYSDAGWFLWNASNRYTDAGLKK